MILAKSLLLGKGSLYYQRESNVVRSAGCRAVVQPGGAARWGSRVGKWRRAVAWGNGMG